MKPGRYIKAAAVLLFGFALVVLPYVFTRGDELNRRNRKEARELERWQEKFLETRSAQRNPELFEAESIRLDEQLLELRMALPPAVDPVEEIDRIPTLAEELGFYGGEINVLDEADRDFYSETRLEYSIASPTQAEVDAWVSALESDEPLRRVSALAATFEEGELGWLEFTVSAYSYADAPR